MKKNYIIYLVAILFTGITIAQETQKNFINYQGVARNGADQLMANETMTIGIALKMGSATGASAYAENHAVTTDANGVFSLKIGNGDAVSGEYITIPWGSEATFVTVLVNGAEIGTSEMMAVPYALSSGDGSQSASEVPYSNTTSGLAATNAQEAIDELVGSGAVDADADPTNEFQTLSFDAVTNELSLTDGNSVVIPSGGTDVDADPTNELQDISLSGTDLSISDGSTIDLSAIIPPGGTDDQNAAEVPFDNAISGLAATDTQAAIEELAAGGLVDTDNQDLSLAGTLLQITDGTGVDLGPLIPAGGTDDQNAGEVPYDNTASGLTAADTQAAIDELAAAGLVDTDDQDLSLSGTLLQITDGAGVDLGPLIPAGGTDDQNAGEVPYDNTTSGLTAADTQAAIDELASGGLVDTDNQNLTFDAVTNFLEIEDGNTVDLSGLAGGGGGSSLWSENGDNIYFNPGNVGIGTDDPDWPLDIALESFISINTTSATATNYMQFNNSTGAVGYSGVWNNERDMDFGTNGSNGTGKVHLVTGSTPKLTVVANGDVGIGTQNPTAKAHILHDSNLASPQLKLEESNSDYARLEFKNQDTGYWHIAGRGGDTGAVSRLNFYHHDGAIGRDYMTIAGSGNVGVGTTSPSSKLDVAGDIKTSGEVQGPNTGSANMIPIAYGQISKPGIIDSGSGNFTVEHVSVGTYRIRIPDSGSSLDWVVSAVQHASFPANITVISSPIYLQVNTYNISGDLIDGRFSFIVYNP